MYLLLLIILGVVSLGVIWQLHEYQRRADARANEVQEPQNVKLPS